MADKLVAADVVALFCDITPRRVQQLAKGENSIFPKASRGKYPLMACVHAYIRYWQLRAEGQAEGIEAWRVRKAAADAQLAEYELALQRQDYIARRDVVAMVREPLDRVNAGLLNAPTKWAARFVGLTTIPESVKLWQQAVDEIRSELRALAEKNLGPARADEDGAKPDS